ncbi:MAG: O-antigen ligase family protein [Saccharospirillaceae bacterium]|nr:O-antigen ligase family protein [Pseudomonadales bacterium]NRB79934.1 O-antigen ligase family protein [Saccharospirillaceae bacterium]
MSYFSKIKDISWTEKTFKKYQYISLLLVLAGILISCIHLNYFYYSYDTPKWFVFDIITSLSIIYYFHNKQKILFSYLGLLILVFSYYMLISIIWAPNKMASVEFSLRFINAVLFIYLLAKQFNKKQLEVTFLKMCFWSALCFSLLFYFERYVLGHTNYNVGNYSPIGFMNNAGAVFNVWLPALVLYGIRQYQTNNRTLFIFCLITIIAVVSILLEAATRATIIGLITFELIVFLIVFRKTKKQAFLYLAISTILTLGMLAYKLSDSLQSDRLEGKLIGLSTNIVAASSTRIKLYKNTLNMTLDNPMGVGINNFEYIHPKYGRPGTKNASPYINEKQILITPHNIVLKIYSELGLIFGTVFVFILFYLLLQAFINALKGNHTDKWLFVGLAATLFHSMLSAVLLTPVSLFFSCMLISLILSRIQQPILKPRNSYTYIPVSIKALYFFVPVIFTTLIYSHYLSFTGYKQDNYKKMIQAIQLNPYNSRALYNLSYYELGKNRDAAQSLKYIDQFLRSYPNHISGLQIKAERHYQLKEYRQATQTIDSVLAFYPSFKTAIRLKSQINNKNTTDVTK